jgi:hypothetical protein
VLAYDFGFAVGGEQFNNGLWVLSPNDPAQVPAQVLPIATNQRLHAVVERQQAQIRVLINNTTPGPSPLQISDVALTGGMPTPAGSAGFMVEPQFSPDGSMIAGYTHPGGALVFYNVEEGTSVSLLNPLAVTGFRWSPS